MDKVSKSCIIEHRKDWKDQEATNLPELVNAHEAYETLSIHVVLN